MIHIGGVYYKQPAFTNPIIMLHVLQGPSVDGSEESPGYHCIVRRNGGMWVEMTHWRRLRKLTWILSIIFLAVIQVTQTEGKKIVLQKFHLWQTEESKFYDQFKWVKGQERIQGGKGIMKVSAYYNSYQGKQ